MIGEAAYIELMKNCSKWNTRVRGERKTKLPFFDQQTAVVHRSSKALHRTHRSRHATSDANYICQYAAYRWKKKECAPSSETTEMKLFMLQNPAIADALNSAQNVNPQIMDLVHPVEVVPEPFVAHPPEPRRSVNVSGKYEEFERDEDDISPSDAGSDGDDWGAKRKGRKRAVGSTKKKAGTIAKESPPKKQQQQQQTQPAQSPKTTAPSSGNARSVHACEICRAKYKSKPGLIHHKAFWHRVFPPATSPHPNKLISPNVDISDYCDLCLGNRFKNSNAVAEDLVSCHDCGRSGHPSCLKFTPNMQFSTGKYGWQCIECKSCAICGTSENDDKLLFCDDCDRGFHLYCLNPPLKSAPENEWSCHLCQAQFGDTASAPASKDAPEAATSQPDVPTQNSPTATSSNTSVA